MTQQSQTVRCQQGDYSRGRRPDKKRPCSLLTFFKIWAHTRALYSGSRELRMEYKAEDQTGMKEHAHLGFYKSSEAP